MINTQTSKAWVFSRKTGLMFFPGVLNEHSGGGLLGLSGGNVSGFESLVPFKGGTGIR